MHFLTTILPILIYDIETIISHHPTLVCAFNNTSNNDSTRTTERVRLRRSIFHDFDRPLCASSQLPGDSIALHSTAPDTSLPEKGESDWESTTSVRNGARFQQDAKMSRDGGRTKKHQLVNGSRQATTRVTITRVEAESTTMFT